MILGDTDMADLAFITAGEVHIGDGTIGDIEVTTALDGAGVDLVMATDGEILTITEDLTILTTTDTIIITEETLMLTITAEEDVMTMLYMPTIEMHIHVLAGLI